MNKEIEIPEGHEARIEGNKVIIEQKSKDERIRNRIISYLKQDLEEYPERKERIEEMLAYLEKQKEQKPAEIHEPSDDELERRQKELYDFKVFAARQARENHISFVHDFEWNNFCEGLLSYFNEQKPAEWSEEDEENFKWFDKLFRAESIVLGGRDIPQDKYLWFKSRRPRHITYALDAPLGYDKDMNPIYPPINHWKPSEDQMTALRNVAYAPNTNNITLQSLYQELRKSYSP